MRILDNRKSSRPWIWGSAALVVAAMVIWAAKTPRSMDIKRLPHPAAKFRPERSSRPAARTADKQSSRFVEGVAFLGGIDSAESSFANDVITIRPAARPAWAYAVVRFREPIDLTRNTLVFKAGASRPCVLRIGLSDAERRATGPDECIAVEVANDRTVSISGRDIKSLGIDKSQVCAMKVSFPASVEEQAASGSVVTVRDIRVESDKEFILEFS